jgi:phospholipid transport system substrate-binding protein
MRDVRWIVGAALLVLFTVVPAWAGPPTDQARQYTDQVTKILQDPAMQGMDKREAVRKVAVQIFDVTETAKRALGRHWQARSPAEREEFVQLFADLLERAYISKIDLYGGERLRYTSETIDGGFAAVKGRVSTQNGSEIPVEARMLQREGRWLIYDIIIENVSLIGNYRAQFDRIIRTSSFVDLMKRLRTRRNEFLNERPRRTSSLESAATRSI